MAGTHDVPIDLSSDSDSDPAPDIATLTKEQANKLAGVAQDGIALAVRPAHTMGDGDTMFAIATGELEGGEPMGRLLAAVAVVTSRAITSGVRAAVGLAGLPAVSELTEAQHG